MSAYNPSENGEETELFRNRKCYFSINVQVVSNANMEITDIVARWQEFVHDSTIFNNSRFCATFEQGHCGDAILLGDNGYPLKPYLLTPLLNPQDAAEQWL
ncbi:putative nuclease HARBI1 isoform X4 [Cephus cinctus]|uniref:Nuclease HARBI1 isoform X4 n=1 Tax=Cephus cinctus TaxID=211228 RepID=A0AAJ7CEY0_CEPCN|nr:putative nuclease HARBI1 isoform X4 [Cephus cinctus]